MEAIAFTLEPRPSSIGWVVAPTYELAERIFRRIAETIQAAFPHRVREYSPREHRLVVTNLGGGRSEVRGKTADNPASLLGEGLSWLVVDESARIPSEVWQGHLSQRLVDQRGRALIISTPRGSGDWFFKAYRLGQKGRNPNYESWSFPSSSNPHLDPAVIEAERASLTPDAFAQEYQAQFLGAELEPCDLCHGPRKGAPGTVVLVNDEEIRRCPECDEAVDEKGETLVALWADGKGHLKVIILDTPDDNRPFVPPPPLPLLPSSAS